MSIANKGKLRSEETKRKISESKKGKKTSKVIKVICITTNDIFNCIEDGVKKYGINESNIINCCKGKQKWAGNHPDKTDHFPSQTHIDPWVQYNPH